MVAPFSNDMQFSRRSGKRRFLWKQNIGFVKTPYIAASRTAPQLIHEIYHFNLSFIPGRSLAGDDCDA
jgi:hypothetical protein